MNLKSSIVPTVKFWLSEFKTALLAILAAILAAIFMAALFLVAGLPKSSVSVQGIAHAQVYDSNLEGNNPKLAVKLVNGNLIHVGVNSPGQVKVGAKLCLYKRTTYIGTVNYAIRAVGKCT